MQGKLLDIIKAKQSKKKKPARKTEDTEGKEAPSNVIDLMAALKKSLGGKPTRKPL